MSQETTAQAAVSASGTAAVVLLLLAQMPDMYRLFKGRIAVTDLSVVPSIGQLGNFVAWVVYALVKNEPALLRVNAIGVGIGCFYLAVFTYYSDRAGRLAILRLAGGSFAVLAIVCGAIIGAMTGDARITALGWTAVLCNTIMFAAPLAAIRTALATMNPDAIPVLLTAAGLACSVLWGTYGILTSNQFVLIPNGAGVGLSLLQIAIAAYIMCAVRRRGFQRVQMVGGDGGGDAESSLAFGASETGVSAAAGSGAHATRRKHTGSGSDYNALGVGHDAEAGQGQGGRTIL